MSKADDISRLVALRQLREERARAAIALENARLKQKQGELDAADAALLAHDADIDEREQRFLDAMNIKPVSERELGRARERIFLSDQRREHLLEECERVAERIAESEKTLQVLNVEWHQRLVARDKLVDMQKLLGSAGRLAAEASSEVENEDMTMVRAEVSC